MPAQILAQLAVPALIEAVKTGLGKIDHPAAKSAVDAITTLQNAVTSGGITPDQMAATHAHIERMAALSTTRDTNMITQTNESLRAEIASNDAYVRRMRPTFGYIMAATWGAQMFALAYLIITDPAHVSNVLNAVESLSTLWVVALSVMGIYVYQRSAEKIAGGTNTPSLINGPATIIDPPKTKNPRAFSRAGERGYND